MPQSQDKFEKENALLFARFDELNGKLNLSLSQNLSDAKKIDGLFFELEKLKEEKNKLVEKNKDLKQANLEMQEKLANLNALEKQNFTISNKIAKIVSDIESQEVREENWKELIDTLISEIDNCISLLENK